MQWAPAVACLVQSNHITHLKYTTGFCDVIVQNDTEIDIHWYWGTENFRKSSNTQKTVVKSPLEWIKCTAANKDIYLWTIYANHILQQIINSETQQMLVNIQKRKIEGETGHIFKKVHNKTIYHVQKLNTTSARFQVLHAQN